MRRGLRRAIWASKERMVLTEPDPVTLRRMWVLQRANELDGVGQILAASSVLGRDPTRAEIDEAWMRLERWVVDGVKPT